MSQFEVSPPYSQRDPSACHQALASSIGLRLGCQVGKSRERVQRGHTQVPQGSGLDRTPPQMAGVLVGSSLWCDLHVSLGPGLLPLSQTLRWTS